MAVMKPDAEGWNIPCNIRQSHAGCPIEMIGTNQAFLYCLFDLLYLDFTESLDFQECLSRSAMDRLNHSQLMKPYLHQRLDVGILTATV